MPQQNTKFAKKLCKGVASHDKWRGQNYHALRHVPGLWGSAFIITVTVTQEFLELKNEKLDAIPIKNLVFCQILARFY